MMKQRGKLHVGVRFKPHGGVRFVAAILLTVTLSSCTTWKEHQQGRTLLSEGRVEEGLEKLRRAAEAEPANVQYRTSYQLEKSSAIGQLLAEAFAALEGGDQQHAEAAFTRVLGLDPNNDRAKAGREHLRLRQYTADALARAEALSRDNRLDEAVNTVTEVLRQSPQDRRAQALSRTLSMQQRRSRGNADGNRPRLNAAYRKHISLAFKKATLLQVFESLKQASGLNFIFDSEVKTDTPVSMTVTRKKLDDVLKILLAGQRLSSKIIDEDTLLIYYNTADKHRDYQDMVIRSFFIANGEASNLVDLLKSVVKIRDVYVDDRLNLLIVRDTPELVQLAERVLQNADMAEPEVTLELEVLEVALSRLTELGIRFPDTLGISVQGSSGVGQLTLPEFQNRSSSLVNLLFNDPLAVLNLRKNTGSTNLLANPRIRTKNRQIARVLIGERVPIITTTATVNVGTAESVNYLDVGLKLELEPIVSLDNEVSMKVALEVSNITGTITRASGLQAFRLGTRNASTTLRVKDGETQVLAGLIQRDERRASTRIPGLGDIPAVGRIFGNQQDNDTKTEIVLLITPRVVRNTVVPSAEQLELQSPSDASISAGTSGSGQTGSRVLPPLPSPMAPNPGTPRNMAPSGSSQSPSPFQSPPLIPSTPSFGPSPSPGAPHR